MFVECKCGKTVKLTDRVRIRAEAIEIERRCAESVRSGGKRPSCDQSRYSS